MTAFFEGIVGARTRSHQRGQGRPVHADFRLGLIAAFGLLFTSLLMAAIPNTASAQERMHQITWAHASPGSVSHFVVLVSDTDGVATGALQVDVGMPQASTAGSLSGFSAVVSFTDSQYLAVAAVGHNGQISLPSDWTGSPPTRPGQPLLVTL